MLAYISLDVRVNYSKFNVQLVGSHCIMYTVEIYSGFVDTM